MWLPIAGANKWVVLMRDKRIRSRPWERQKLVDHGVRAFCLTHAGNYSKWHTLELLVKRWQDFELISMVESGPYIYSVTHSSLKALAMPGQPEP